jgi:aquaporin Z
MRREYMKKYGAEFFGTFRLVMGGCGSAVFAAAFSDAGAIIYRLTENKDD